MGSVCVGVSPNPLFQENGHRSQDLMAGGVGVGGFFPWKGGGYGDAAPHSPSGKMEPGVGLAQLELELGVVGAPEVGGCREAGNI